MKIITKNLVANALFGACVIALAAALAWPLFFLAPEKKAEYISRRNGTAINIALVTYYHKHEGSYPGDGQIAGGAGDVLTNEKIILRYPDNPFAPPGTLIKKVPFGKPSPGDFSYSLNKGRLYGYNFVVYGRRGVVFSKKYGG